MMSVPVLAGIQARTISTRRLTTRVLFSGDEAGIPVLFLHGNSSSATWWEPVMLDLPEGFRGIAPDNRGYGGADPAKKIDATRGMGDLADDAVELLDYLGVEKAHIVGISMGGSILWRMLADYPARFLKAVVINPGSPYGFGGTKDVDGRPCYEDFAGSGGGLVPAAAVQYMTDPALIDTTDSPLSPRNRMKGLYANPAFENPHGEAWLAAFLSTHFGERDFPGDSVQSANWPYIAPGVWGANNALSPKYNQDVSRLYAIGHKPPILWIRGGKDAVVSDRSLRDIGTLGEMGFFPGWPGADVFPPQPMVGQTRVVLEQYRAAGGWYEEVVIADTGHVPYIEQPEVFNALLHGHLQG